MLLAGKSVINLAKFPSVIFAIRREPNTRHAVLINPYYATNFLLVGTLSIGISSYIHTVIADSSKQMTKTYAEKG